MLPDMDPMHTIDPGALRDIRCFATFVAKRYVLMD